MVTSAQISAALATLVAGTGLQTIDHIPSAWPTGGPFGYVRPGPATRLVVNTGMLEREWTIYVAVPFGTDRPGQLLLQEYLDGTGARSIIAALHANPTLGLEGVSCSWQGDGGVENLADELGLSAWGAVIRTLVQLPGV